MPVRKYRKKPVVIEALEWNGTNDHEVLEFLGEADLSFCFPPMLPKYWVIETLEGEMTANIGDFIIKGVAGEFYPCKPDIFHATYEEVKQ